jgi:hypothetical protein
MEKPLHWLILLEQLVSGGGKERNIIPSGVYPSSVITVLAQTVRLLLLALIFIVLVSALMGNGLPLVSWMEQ